MFSKSGAPLFDTIRLVHNQEENAAVPSGLLEQCRKPAVAETHLWRRKDYPVELFLQVLWVPSANASAYNKNLERTFRTELSRAFHMSLFMAMVGIPSLVVKKRA